MTQGVEPVARTDITPSTTGSWVDVNVSSYVDAGYTAGVMLEIVNADSTDKTWGVRKNGSSSTLTGTIKGNSHTFVAIGVDNYDKFEAYVSASYLYIYIVGYIPGDAGSFKTNPYNFYVSSTYSWTDLDVSGQTDGDCKIAFFLVKNTGSSSYNFGLRENGSTDDRHRNIVNGALIGAMMSVDSSEILEYYITSAYVDIYFVGYIRTGYVETFTNAKDYSTSTRYSYVDVDFSDDIPSYSQGVFLHLYGYSSTDDFGIRKNGESYLNRYGFMNHQYGWCAVDSNSKAEQYISNTSCDLYLWGYSVIGDAVDPSSGWSYYKQIDVTDTADVSSRYQMKLTVYSGSGSDSTADGIIYCNNYCESFPDDIRFGTTNDPSTAEQLAQWIEDSDATSAIIWVKLPSDGSNTMYMFVGNSSASEYSSGDDTFLFFDDFEGTSLDMNKWNVDTGVNVVVSNSILHLWEDASNNDKIETKTTFSYPKRFRARANLQDKGSQLGFSNMLDGGNDDFKLNWRTTSNYYEVYSRKNGSSTYSYFSTLGSDTYRKWEIIWRGTASSWGTIEDEDDTVTISNTNYIPTENLGVLIRNYYNGDIYVDWVFVSKYASTEPSWSSFGSWTAISGGEEYETTLTDAVTLSDSTTHLPSIFKTENLNLTDNKLFTSMILKTDNTSLSDNLLNTTNILKSEQTTLLDNLLTYLTAAITNTDNITLSDSLSRVSTFSRQYSETISLLADLFKDITLEETDGFTVSDSIVKTQDHSDTDNIVLADGLNKKPSKNSLETLVLTDVLIRDVVKTLQENLSTTDSIIKTQSATKTETISLTDVLVKGISLYETELLSFNDNVFKTTVSVLQQTLTLSDVVTKLAALVKDNVLSLSDTIVTEAQKEKILSDNSSLSDKILNTTSISQEDTFSLDDSIINSLHVSRTLTDTLTLLDNISKLVALVKSATTTLSDDLTTEATKSVYLTDNPNLTDNVLKTTSYNLDDTLSLIDNLFSQIDVLKTETLNLLDDIVTSVSTELLCLADLNLSDVLTKDFKQTLIDALQLTTVVVKQINLLKTDGFTLNDSLEKNVKLLRQETISLADNLLKQINSLKTEDVNLTDVVGKDVGVTVEDFMSLSDFLAKTINILQTDNITVDGNVLNTVGVEQTETLNLLDDKQLQVNLSKLETLSLLVENINNTGIINKETISLLDTIVKEFNILFEESFRVLDEYVGEARLYTTQTETMQLMDTVTAYTKAVLRILKALTEQSKGVRVNVETLEGLKTFLEKHKDIKVS